VPAAFVMTMLTNRRRSVSTIAIAALGSIFMILLVIGASLCTLDAVG
jgi:hypothetical protein